MTTTAASAAPVATAPRVRAGRAALLLVAAAVVAIGADAVVGAAAVAAGADPAFTPLSVVAIAPSVAVGLALATAGWALVVRFARDSVAVLRVLVPVLTVLSFTPDVVLAVTGFIPGASITGVVGLMIMHLVTVAVAVPVLQRAIPARRG